MYIIAIVKDIKERTQKGELKRAKEKSSNIKERRTGDEQIKRKNRNKSKRKHRKEQKEQKEN